MLVAKILLMTIATILLMSNIYQTTRLNQKILKPITIKRDD